MTDQTDQVEAAGGGAPGIRASYTMPRSEWIRVLPSIARRSRGARIAAVTLAVLGVVLLAVGMPVLGVLELALAALFGSGLYCLPIFLLGARRQRLLLERPVELVAGSTGIRARNGLVESSTTWPAYRRAWESAAYFFLEIGPGTVVVPKRGFGGGGEAAFRSLLTGVGLLH